MLCLILLAATTGFVGEYEWHPWNDGSEEYSLRLNGLQVGSYNAATDTYRPYDRHTKEWGPMCRPPVEPPVRNFGVMMSGTSSGTHYRRGGSEISSQEADTYLSGTTSANPLSADSRKHIVVIGPDAATAPVVAWLKTPKAIRELRDSCIVQAFRPDDWQVKDGGFLTGGNPTIYFLDAGGKVLYRRDDAACGDEALIEALRDADPDYQPADDPGPANSSPAGNELATALELGACLAFAVALCLFIWGYRRWRMA